MNDGVNVTMEADSYHQLLKTFPGVASKQNSTATTKQTQSIIKANQSLETGFSIGGNQ